LAEAARGTHCKPSINNTQRPTRAAARKAATLCVTVPAPPPPPPCVSTPLSPLFYAQRQQGAPSLPVELPTCTNLQAHTHTRDTTLQTQRLQQPLQTSNMQLHSFTLTATGRGTACMAQAPDRGTRVRRRQDATTHLRDPLLPARLRLLGEDCSMHTQATSITGSDHTRAPLCAASTAAGSGSSPHSEHQRTPLCFAAQLHTMISSWHGMLDASNNATSCLPESLTATP